MPPSCDRCQRFASREKIFSFVAATLIPFAFALGVMAWINFRHYPIENFYYLLIILATFVEPTFWWLLGLMLLFSWTSLVAVVRAEFLRARNFDYVRAARALGVSDRVIIFRHVLPNATVATITFLPFILNGSITTLTSLDFLGFGLPPGSASLGELLAQGKANLQAPWLGITAFFVLALMLSLLIFVGEAVRDAFDPRKVTPMAAR